MNVQYDIKMGPRKVGSATIEKQGLFYHISCVCHFEDRRQYRIYVTGPEQKLDLGICVSKQKISVRLPVKRVGDGVLQFYAVESSTAVKYYPVHENEPFVHLERLLDAHMRREKGEACIVFTEDLASDSQDSGPIR